MISVVSMKVGIMQMLTEPKTLLTFRMRSPTERVPSSSAGPPGMILVRKIPSSPRTCWLPRPPAMLKPRPSRRGERGWASWSILKGLCTCSRREGLNIQVHDCTHTDYDNVVCLRLIPKLRYISENGLGMRLGTPRVGMFKFGRVH